MSLEPTLYEDASVWMVMWLSGRVGLGVSVGAGLVGVFVGFGCFGGLVGLGVVDGVPTVMFLAKSLLISKLYS
jgi:hypothetical protein